MSSTWLRPLAALGFMDSCRGDDLEHFFQHPIPIYYDLHIPEVIVHSPVQKLPFLIAFHGYGGNKESMMAVAKKIIDPGMLIASLQAPYPFVYPFAGDGFQVGQADQLKVGFGWATRWKDDESIRLHHQIVLRLLEEVQRKHPLDSSKIFLFAFSQPSALNYRFTFSYPNLIRGAIVVCGGIPGDWQTAAYQSSNTDVLHIATDSDPFYPLERSKPFEDQLRQRASAVEFCVFKGGHKIPGRAIPHIRQWIQARL